MPRDYARKTRPAPRRKAPPKRQLPGWLWLFIGGILGGFVTFLVYLWDIAPPPSQVVKTPTASETPAADNKAPKPRFDFYKLLQESEVIVPATEPAQVSVQTPPSSAPAQTSADEFILQVGSFASEADADRLRAQLLMLNLEARLEKVTIRNGEVWHRVVVGPFTDQARLNSARSTLVNNQYNALMLKRNKQ